MTRDTAEPDQPLLAPVSQALYRLSRAHRLAAATLLRKVGLYPGQEIMLSYLADHGDQRQSTLVLALSIDPSTVTKMLTRLQNHDLVQRRPCPEDGRVSLVSITEQGLELTRQLTKYWADLEHWTTANLSDEQCAQLRGTLSQIETNLSMKPASC